MITIAEKLVFAKAHWNLRNIEIIYENADKAVYSAVSSKFGDVILKVNQNTLQLKEEYDTLCVMNGSETNKYCCRSFRYDEEKGILLEERLLPGTVLREEPSLEVRIYAFERVFRNIHKEIVEDGCQTYLEWLQEICDYCEKHQENRQLKEKYFGEWCLADYAERARGICEKFFDKYPERMLLHGDLHHDNILLREDGSYAMIDPKGVVGPEILDLPRYIMNEIDTKHECSDKEHMQRVVQKMSEVFGYPEIEVARAYFMEVVLGNVWCAGDGEDINVEEIEIAEEILFEIAKKKALATVVQMTNEKKQK